MKRLSIVLIILILISVIPIKSFAISSEQEFYEYLDSIGQERKTERGRVASYKTYKEYNLIVYGDPWGDTKPTGINGKTGSQKRYLGYTLDDKSYTNPYFPPDPGGSGNKPEQFNYIKPSGAIPSWDIKDTAQRSYMKTATLSGNGASSPSFNVNYIGGEAYAKVLSASTWKGDGAIYTNHKVNGVKRYATFTTPPMVGDTIVTGEISTPSDTYYIRKDETQVTIPTTVTANAVITGSAKKDHIEEIKATSVGGSQTASRKSTVSKTSDFVATRANYKPGTHTVTLNGSVSLKSIFNDTGSSNVSKTIKLIVEAEGDEPYVITTVTPDPKQKKFEKKDIDVKLTIKGDLHNYTKAENVMEWVFYAREKEKLKAVIKKSYKETLSETKTFDFKIPAEKIVGDNYLQHYTVRARAYFYEKVNGKAYYDAPAETFVSVYKKEFKPPIEEPEEPEEPDNKPPVARIFGPKEVIIGETANFKDMSWDSDGEIVERMWTHDINAGDLSGEGGEITFNNLGIYNIWLYVVDDLGAGDDTEHQVKVIPPPPPIATLKFNGVLKENRIFIIENKSSSHRRFPIIEEKTKITIEPIDHDATDRILYNGKLTDKLSKEIVFKDEGTYKFTIYVENTAGLSDTKEYIKYVQPDIPPIADFSMIQKIYRDPYDNNYSKMEITDFSFSPDGDPITERIWKIKYNSTNNKNSDGTNNFSDDPTLNIKDSQLTIGTEKTYRHNGVIYKVTKIAKDKINIKVNQIGYYLLDLEVIEGIGQDYIPEYINPSDYQKADTSYKHHFEKTIKVDNREPFVDFN